MTDELLPLTAYESDPSFQSLDEAGKSEFYDGYFKLRSESAKNEDDYNSLMKDKADRSKAALLLEYQSNFPEDKEVDPMKLGEGFVQKFGDVSRMYNELDYNINQAQLESVSADDMEDPNRSFAFKPFKYNGESGYTVKYPNGEVESIKGLSSKSQLTDYLKKNKADKFNGVREGVLDSTFGDSELDLIANKLNRVDDGVKGNINAFRKGFSGVLQSFYANSALNQKEDQKTFAEYQDKASQLTEIKKSLEGKNLNDPNNRDLIFRKTQLENDLRNLDQARTIAPVNPENITQSYSQLISEFLKSQEINGTQALDDYEKYIASQPEDVRGEAGTFASYFAKNPGEIMPYVAATVSSSLPDVIAGVGASVVGGISGGPLGAATAGGSYGAAREYAATLLSEIQLRAASEGAQLTDPAIIDRYMSDNVFMDTVKEKAAKRATVIGAADAVLGGGVSKLIENTTMSAFKKAVTGGALGAISESTGEYLAQAATEDKINFTEVFNEGLGGTGASVVTGAGAVAYEKFGPKNPERLKAEADAKARDIKAEVDRAASLKTGLPLDDVQNKTQLTERVDAISEQFKVVNERPKPKVDTTAFAGEQDQAFNGEVESPIKASDQGGVQYKFKTEDSNEFEYNGSSTIKRKNLGPDLESGNQADSFGDPKISNKTVFLSSKDVKNIQKEIIDKNPSKSYSVELSKDGSTINVLEVGKNGKSKKIKSIPAISVPKIGMIPAEVYKNTNSTEGQGMPILIGSPITSLEKIKQTKSENPFSGKEQKPLSGQVQKPFTGEQQQALQDEQNNQAAVSPEQSDGQVLPESRKLSVVPEEQKTQDTQTNSSDAGTQLTETQPVQETANIPHLPEEVSQETQQAAKDATTETEKEVVQRTAREEIQLNRFNKLKALYPSILEGRIFTGEQSLVEARDAIVYALDQEIDTVDAEGKEVSEKKIAAAKLLVENKALVASSLKDLIHNPSITYSQAQHLMDAVEYVIEATQNPSKLTARKLNYYNRVLESLTDGGTPTGFKYIAAKVFTKRWESEYKKRGLTPNDFSLPMDNWRRSAFFGAAPSTFGGMASVASEISLIGKTEKAHQFLKDMMGTYKDNIDKKQLAEATLKAEFYEHLNKEFPKGSLRPLQAMKIGIAARMTQFKRDKNKTPIGYIIDRTSQLTEAIKQSMTEYDPDTAKLAQKAYDELMRGTDITTFSDEKSAIAFIESGLTAKELSVLNKVRDIGARLLPSLKTAKAITKNVALEEWVNYVHDASSSPRETKEQSLQAAFDSMGDVLVNRERIDPAKTFPELDIRGVAEHQIKSSTYEQHTAVERYMLAKALAEKGPISKLLDSGKGGFRPVSDRLRNIFVTYHNAMTKHQEVPNAMWGFVDNLVGAIQGSLVVGVNALTKNFVSSSVARMNLLALNPTGAALRNILTYDWNSKQIFNFIKKNFPTQFDRTNEYDILEGREERWNLKGKIKGLNDIKTPLRNVVVKSALHLPNELINLYSTKILSTLGKFSNSIPERRSAFAIWTAAYIEFGKRNGTIKDTNDFLKNMPVDRRAAADASDFVTQSLGYSPDKAGKGSFWNGSSSVKRITSKALFAFRQQSTGLAFEFQNNIMKASRLMMSGNKDEAFSAGVLAMNALINSMAFRAASIALASSMVYTGLDRFFKSNDEEEEKRKLLAAKNRYQANSEMNNLRDFAFETVSAVAPITNSASILEGVAAIALDGSDVSFSIDNGKVLAKAKADLKVELESVRKEIQEIERAIRKQEKMGLDTTADEEALEKLELAETQLTDKINFKYFTNVPDKAWLNAYGAYGIAGESAMKIVDAWMDKDISTEEKKELQNILDKEYAWNDPMAGAGWQWDTIKGASDLVRRFMPSDALTSSNKKLPTELFWATWLRMGQNPGVVVERGRREMAKDALKEMKAAQRRAEEIESKYFNKQ